MDQSGPLRPFIAASTLAITAAVAAQPSAPAPAAARSASAAAAITPSAFAGYRGFDDPEPIAWPQANETVRAVGGWRAYAKEAQAQTAPAPAAPAPAASAPAGGAHGHGHGGAR